MEYPRFGWLFRQRCLHCREYVKDEMGHDDECPVTIGLISAEDARYEAGSVSVQVMLRLYGIAISLAVAVFVLWKFLA